MGIKKIIIIQYSPILVDVVTGRRFLRHLAKSPDISPRHYLIMLASIGFDQPEVL
ncbi:hypothetical protein GCM10022260_17310 [Gaetbulibacter aestuarii]